MFYILSITVLGFLLDALFGDPHWMPHPVRLMGWLITALERPIRALFPKHARGERWGGGVLTVLTVGLTGGAAYGLVWAAGLLHPMAAYLLEVFICYQVLAAQSLRKESMRVSAALEKGDLAAARVSVSMIVGRDTAHLTPTQVVKAAVETVAENTADGVIAPLFFCILGGAPLGLCYKAVNTLDSMIGYKNETYRHFGTVAARLDDAANYFPARLAALLMIGGAWLCGLDGRGAYRVWKRDRRCHASPNSAQTEAVCAGALGIQLAGNAVYGGVTVKKPTIGDAVRPAVTGDIRLANRLMYTASVLALGVFSMVRLALTLLF